MFGRRNPDLPPSALPPTPSEDDLNLDLLPDIPDLPPPESREPASPPPPVPPGDPAWYASAPVAPSPPPSSAVTQRLPIQPEPPAPPPTSPDAITESQSAAQTRPPSPAPPFALPTALTPAPSPAPAAPPSSSAALLTSVLMKNAGAPPQPQPAAESVIGPDDFFDGRYRSERGVRIQGNARGSIESRQYIFIEAGAVVEADLSAEDITVAGSTSGTIECRRRLEVMSTGKVQGHVQSALLIVQEGGLLDGELHMRGADARPVEPQGGAPESRT